MLKVAMVGCGQGQTEHCKQLSTLPDARIVAHCDVERARAEAAASCYGGEPFSDFEAMYDKAKPQAVYVSVPPYAHTGIEEAAAERGIHLFIEKPISLDHSDAKRIGAAIKKADIIASVGYCWRYYDTVALARQILKGKAISLVRGCWNTGIPEAGWRRRMDKSGGQIVEQATHVFDLIRYLCGDVAEVYAAASNGCMTKIEHYDIHDSSVVSLRLKNGAVGVVTSTCVSSNGSDIGLEIITPELILRFAAGSLTVCEDGKVTHYAPRVNTYEEENKAFVEAARTGKRTKIRSTYGDAAKTSLVTCAANESIRSGMAVKL